MPLQLMLPGMDFERDRILIMGDAKVGKTPVALAAAMVLAKRRNPKGKAAYIAIDPGSENAIGIPEEWRDSILVFRPTGKDGAPYDPQVEAFNIATADWKAIDPDIELLIIDSKSEQAEQILQHIADSGFFAGKDGDKHVEIGVEGQPGTMKIPVRGDYGAIKGIFERLTKLEFRQPLDLICITHLEIDGNKGGPALVGKALTRDYPRHFNAVLRVEKVPLGAPGEKPEFAIRIHTEGDNFWIGGIRHRPGVDGPANPVPVVQCGKDLTAFWRFYLKTYRTLPDHLNTETKDS